MRPIIITIFFAATTASLATAPAAAVDRLKLLATVNMGVAGAERGKEKWIEIQGWDWGRTAKVEGFAINQGPARDDHEEEMTIVAGQAASPPGGAEKFGAVSGMHRDSSVSAVGASEKMTVDGGRTETASGQATGKRQHMPIRSRTYVNQTAAPAEKRQHGWNSVSKPLDRGAIRVKVKFPWVDCRVGTRFPAALLENATGTHELTDVTVASCTQDSFALNYAKVKVRGWNPEKKEE